MGTLYKHAKKIYILHVLLYHVTLQCLRALFATQEICLPAAELVSLNMRLGVSFFWSTLSNISSTVSLYSQYYKSRAFKPYHNIK